MTKLSALLTVADFGAQGFALTNPIQEIGEMDGIAAMAINFAHQLIVQVIDFRAASRNHHSPFFCEKAHAKRGAFEPAWVTTLADPLDPLIAEIKHHRTGVGR